MQELYREMNRIFPVWLLLYNKGCTDHIGWGPNPDSARIHSVFYGNSFPTGATSAEKFPFLGHIVLALSIKWSYCLDFAFTFEPISEKQPKGKIGKKTSKFSLFLHLRKSQMCYPLSVSELKIQWKHCIWDYMESRVKT